MTDINIRATSQDITVRVGAPGASDLGATLAARDAAVAAQEEVEAIAGTLRFVLSVALSGGVPGSGAIVEGHTFVQARSFPVNLTGSRATARTAATAEAVFNIMKNGVTIGTCTFAAAGTTGTFVMASAQSFAAGDQFDIECPDPADATLAGIKFSFLAT